MRSPLNVRAPANWGLASLSLFYEGEDLSQEAHPFAASVVMQLRMEVPKGAPPAVVRDRDLSTAQAQIVGLHLIGKGRLEIPGGGQNEYLEWIFPDPAVDTVHQIVLYVSDGSRLYTFTATHREDRFDSVRSDLLRLASELKASVASGAERS
jgi:hypothetical protein